MGNGTDVWILGLPGPREHGGRWGSGPTLTAAKASFRRAGGVLGMGYTVLTFDRSKSSVEGIDGMGDVHYQGEAPDVAKVPRRKEFK